MGKGCISDQTLKYITYEYKKSTNLGKVYLLPKIHERINNIPGRPEKLRVLWFSSEKG